MICNINITFVTSIMLQFKFQCYNQINERSVKQNKMCICHIHDVIKDNITSLIINLEDHISNNHLSSEDEKIINNSILNLMNIKQDIIKANIKAQNMEDRLKEYKTTIEGLGFQRVR